MMKKISRKEHLKNIKPQILLSEEEKELLIKVQQEFDKRNDEFIKAQEKEIECCHVAHEEHNKKPPENIVRFIEDYINLCKKHQLVIRACGCCNSPWVREADSDDMEREKEHLIREASA